MNTNFGSYLPGHWVHSHEEDKGNQMVFRPSSRPLPPSRGRYEYQFEPGGRLRFIRPGPTDKRESVSGTWQLEEGGILVLHPGEGAPLRFQIASVDAERLIVNRL